MVSKNMQADNSIIVKIEKFKKPPFSLTKIQVPILPQMVAAELRRKRDTTSIHYLPEDMELL